MTDVKGSRQTSRVMVHVRKYAGKRATPGMGSGPFFVVSRKTRPPVQRRQVGGRVFPTGPKMNEALPVGTYRQGERNRDAWKGVLCRL